MRALERRLRKLESISNTDPSGYPPNSSEWLDYWDREVYRYMSGDTGACLTLAGVRAAMQHAGDPGSLLGAFSESPD
jgi:hypothetical protein